MLIKLITKIINYGIYCNYIKFPIIVSTKFTDYDN